MPNRASAITKKALTERRAGSRIPAMGVRVAPGRHRYQIIMDDAELTRYAEAAQADGLDLASWIRSRLKRAADAELREADVPAPPVTSRRVGR